ncbi:hypothetical protein CP970_26765 [Streptomyces kanamyceticus]|uniref:Uncharacterized protein n=1 Tax=Streptomyces kanamyceticus TaxID=1967 RepID=A0A5J6GFW8_STRKN|nr:hypothetical protein [Streptomyces kanamyceticus]QEU94023.1 hypothetical protein CP970_26765 [Streptomyces kanamyceticus]
MSSLRSTRFRAERAAAGRGGDPLPAPVHLSLRDSRTLNVAVAADPARGDVARARLLITRGLRRYAVPLALKPQAHGAPLLTATATLRDARDGGRPGVPLSDGVWRLTVETRGARGRVRRHGLGIERAPALPPTPTLPHAPDPRTGTLVRIVRTRGGRAVLQATRSLPRAELVRFVPGGDGITVHGRLVAGAPGSAGARGRAVRRRDGVVVPVEVDWRADEFTLRVPLAEMTGAGPGQWVWDFRVGELPLGRWLSDVRDPAASCPTPFRVFALPDGGLTRAHAHFTASGAFAVTCLDLTDPTDRTNPADHTQRTPESAKETS